MHPEEKRYGCGSIRVGLDIWKCEPAKLTNPNAWDVELRRLVTQRHLGPRKTFIDPYEGEGSGFELFLTLDDSFIVIETWPKGKPNICPYPYVKIVIDFCHHSGDHSEDAYWVADKIENFLRWPGMVSLRECTDHGP